MFLKGTPSSTVPQADNAQFSLNFLEIILVLGILKNNELFFKKFRTLLKNFRMIGVT